jgi:hypothetical protein
MPTATGETRPVAKKRGRPKSERPRGEGKAVRLDPDVVGMARTVVMRRNLELGPYLSELLKGAVRRDYVVVLKELSKEFHEKEGGAK